ncbi:MAG: NUDIX domain-containing protein [Pseudohongiellaceae bacterium]
MVSEYLQPEFSRKDVDVLGREVVYSGFFSLERISLRHRRYEGGWTPLLVRELFVRPRAVGVLLYDPQLREVVLIEQCRVGALDIAEQPLPGTPDSPWLLELVAGLVEPGETAEAVAHREAEEEAGCRIERLIPLPCYLSSPGGSNEWITLFCGLLDASQAGGIHGLAEENEDIRALRLPLSDLGAAMAAGRLSNAMTLIAVQWLLLNESGLDSLQCEEGHRTTTAQDDIK